MLNFCDCLWRAYEMDVEHRFDGKQFFKLERTNVKTYRETRKQHNIYEKRYGRHKFLMDSKMFSCYDSAFISLGRIFLLWILSFSSLSFINYHFMKQKETHTEREKEKLLFFLFSTENAQFSNKQKWWRKTIWRRHTKKKERKTATNKNMCFVFGSWFDLMRRHLKLLRFSLSTTTRAYMLFCFSSLAIFLRSCVTVFKFQHHT